MEPSILSAVLSKALQAQRAAEAAKKARELVRRKGVLGRSTLPGKLADCTSTDLTQSEIFLVEGDSAGAPASPLRAGRLKGRPPGYGAENVLPLTSRLYENRCCKADVSACLTD